MKRNYDKPGIHAAGIPKQWLRQSGTEVPVLVWHYSFSMYKLPGYTVSISATPAHIQAASWIVTP